MTLVSVIVPTYNRVQSLRRLMEALEGQTLPTTEFEVVVVDDGSSDDTLPYITALPRRTNLRVVPLNQRNSGPAAARNKGVFASCGDLLIFTDDDCVPERGWLEAMRRFYDSNPEVGGFGGRIQRMRDTPLSKWIDERGIMHHPHNDTGECVYLVTANAAYTRTSFDAVGGFKEDITWPGGEDPEFSHRVRSRGGKLVYCHDGVIRHEHRDSYLGLYKMFYNHGRGSAFEAESHIPARRYWAESMRCAWSHLRMSIQYASRPQLSVRERLVELSCGWVRGAGFCKGRVDQLKRGHNSGGNHRATVS
jgi:glycosyltransferase involved in cell wall biosynthesis